MTISKSHHKWNSWNRGGHLGSKWSLKHMLAMILSVFVVYISISAGLSQHWQIQATSYEDTFVTEVEGEAHSYTTWISPASMLLAKTREAVLAAGGVPGTVLSEEDWDEWEKKYPCRGRNELLALWTRKNNGSADSSVSEKASMKLDRLFQEYLNLHRTCTHGGNMSYVSDLYNQREIGSANCKFLVVEFGVYGVGNRVLWLVSAYMYALLTQRVLLIDTRDTIHQILCDPFPGSSWQLPQNFPYSSSRRWVMPEAFFKAWDDWEDGTSDAAQAKEEEKKNEKEVRKGGGEREYTADDLERERKQVERFIQASIKVKSNERNSSDDDDDDDDDTDDAVDDIDGRRRSLLATPTNSSSSATAARPRGPPPIFNSTQANDGWSPNPRFFCENDQQRLQQVPWLSLSGGCLYFLPDLFAVTSFMPALEELFPLRDPLTYLLRQIVYPVDAVWNRVVAVYKVQFQTARKVIGMQVRFRDGGAMYVALNGVVNQRITTCALENQIIPINSLNSTYFNDIKDNGGRPVVIFIASLHMGLQIHLHEYYAALFQSQMETGQEFLKLIQMTHSGFQAFNLDGDFQAFAELLMLSLVDELVTSPMSTFGYVAQAFAGLRPWLIEFNTRKDAPCQRGQSSDACYQMAVSKYICPADPELNGKLVRDVVPYLQPCQDTDGLQLISPMDV